jgi:hypothetical protein
VGNYAPSAARPKQSRSFPDSLSEFSVPLLPECRLPDDKLTGFALRLVITAHIPIPREGELDYLTEVETAFAPPQPKKSASKKMTTKPTPIKAAKKGAAKKTTAQKEVAA